MAKMFLSAGLLAVLLAALAAGCQSAPPAPKTDAELGLKPQQARGRRIYNVQCIACHEPYSSLERNGPSLQGMYNKRQLVSGAPANDERVRDAIVVGRAKMPAYGHMLSQEQLDDLIAYLHTL
ncbi:MAG: c-type cytochrome [Terriglobales bacterium]